MDEPGTRPTLNQGSVLVLSVRMAVVSACLFAQKMKSYMQGGPINQTSLKVCRFRIYVCVCVCVCLCLWVLCME